MTEPTVRIKFTVETPGDLPFQKEFQVALSMLVAKLIDEGVAAPVDIVRGLHAAGDALTVAYRAKPREEPAGFAILNADRGDVDGKVTS